MGDRADSAASDVLLHAFGRAKRQQAAAACQRCRVRKTKCGGERPCASCAAAGVECVWITQENETRRQAIKRKHDEMLQATEPVMELHNLLMTADQDQAFDILRRVRAGQSIRGVLGHHHDIQQAHNFMYEQRVYGQLFISLAQPTAPLKDIVAVAEHIFNNSLGLHQMPAPDALRSLRSRVIKLEEITGRLPVTNGMLTETPQSSKEPRTNGHDPRDQRKSVPIHRVPASPWVSSSSSTDDGVSDLVSTYLSVTNPFARHLEPDLFLADMRSRDQHSHFCSPLLVHAVLACGSLFSEHDEAFTYDHDYLTRGEHYHKEALRLWELEKGRVSITNAQALSILSGESSWRGQDRLGWSLHQDLARMIKDLNSSEIPCDMDAQATRAYKRARACIASCVVRNHMYWIMGLFGKSGNEIVCAKNAPDLRHILKDEVMLWRPYPCSRQDPIPMHMNLMALENQSLSAFLWEILHGVCAEDRDLTQPAFWKGVRELESRMRYWYQYLPAPLHYTPKMPTPLYEFHAQYFVAQMMLNDHWAEVLLSEASIYFDKVERDAVRSRTLRYAIQSTAILRDYRQHYGYKQTPPFLFQVAAMVASILLRCMDRDKNPSKRCLHAPEVIAAFEDCCRCLLAFSMHLMLPRGINRMLHRTALEMGVKLPESVERMLEFFGKNVWTEVDWKRISSEYPNILRGPASRPGGQETIEAAVRELKI
ncbi:unnamed protein product [Cercospora beticola]|nr:unnamed protein product [Cercospora beticola]